MNYKNKYLKYKIKYLNLLKQSGGMTYESLKELDLHLTDEEIKNILINETAPIPQEFMYTYEQAGYNNGFTFTNVPGDGNCLFSVLALILEDFMFLCDPRKDKRGTRDYMKVKLLIKSSFMALPPAEKELFLRYHMTHKNETDYLRFISVEKPTYIDWGTESEIQLFIKFINKFYKRITGEDINFYIDIYKYTNENFHKDSTIEDFAARNFHKSCFARIFNHNAHFQLLKPIGSTQHVFFNL